MGELKSAQTTAFLRFASSESDDSEGEEAAKCLMESKYTRRSEHLLSQREQFMAVLTSPKQAQSTRKQSTSLMFLTITLTDDENGDWWVCYGENTFFLVMCLFSHCCCSVSTIVPVSEASHRSVSVFQVKMDAIKQIQANYAIKDATAFHRLLERGADNLILYLEIQNQWLKDEELSIGHYLFGCANRRIHLELVPMHKMPQPTLDVTIAGTKNKVSDLSQREFTCYVIDVVFNGTTWQLVRCYKEFDTLTSQLNHKYPAMKLPDLPPKHVFTRIQGALIEYRKEQLEAFLKHLIRHPVVSTDVLVMSARYPELGHKEKSVIHVTSLHESVKYGGIILFSCRFGASRLQRKFTGSKYDHAGIVVPGESPVLLRIMEATSDGIQTYVLKTRLMVYACEVSNRIVVRRVQAGRSPELVTSLQKFVRRVDGNPYSILGILNSSGESDKNGFNALHAASITCNEVQGSTSGTSASSAPSSPVMDRPDATKSKQKYFCSSLVASAWKELGWLQTKRKSTSFWPGSFEDAGEVERLLAPGVAIEPETIIDCRIVEVGLAAHH
ncbi:hypothetical protein PsorP6_005043 [Peronosclerospora sorghi]|uniref:Uncharacterized protein n=1 Tax=Peronosclerospora sorghi TaxID=230839 RepID=A0ACC0W5J9_9STRA|nr:hypothetical protein PsorP6_005043 [Peronosclerospora sorghi]